ncbi:MAG: DUF4328 domain-containing protein [Caulobacter sp.]|nr:DUF4328 domain-containing protein [Caulobacter sp.]
MTTTKSPTRLAGFVIAATWTFCAMKLTLMAVMAINFAYASGWLPSDFSYGAFGRLVGFSIIGNLGVQFVAGVLSLVWIYRVARNAQRMARYSLPISSGWAVGWYFIPIGALWKPFEAMEQTWKASLSPTGWRSIPTPALLRWWWGFWLAGGAGGALIGGLGRAGVNSPALTSALLVVVSGLVVAQCVLFNRIVRRLTDLQAAAVDVRVFD